MNNLFEYVFDFIYGEAMNDATRRTEAASIKDEVLKCKEVKERVWKYANAVINGEAPAFCDCEEDTEEILKKHNINNFTFGNIQKLINMTMKYLYIRYYDTEKRGHFSCCDAPMDRKMKDYVYKEYVKKTGKKPDFDIECAWSKMSKSSDKSKYSYKNYYSYQAAIDELKEHNNRLDYEFMNFNKANRQ